MEGRDIQTFTHVWDGITLEISYEEDWLSGTSAHIQVRSIDPEREPLPITETGYRSHFCAPGDVTDHGGPVAYVMAWIDAEAETETWKKAKAARAQLSLF